MKKVLIVYNNIWPYRERVFELLGSMCDLTVGFNNPEYLGKTYPFKTIYIPGWRLGPFFVHRPGLYNLASRYDSVIGLYDIRWISVMLLCINPFRKFSMSLWGIGVTASYKNHYDTKKTWDFVRHFFARRAESIILYSEYPVRKHVLAGIAPAALFVANNTVAVDCRDGGLSFDGKRNFLFVGTLYPQKGLDILLEAYRCLCLENADAPLLEIVGDGPERDKVDRYIALNGLESRIILHGSVYDVKRLSAIYERALACISPCQAGLSVLASMGNATIFVTQRNAVTGGEIFSIDNGINGIVCEDGRIKDALQWIANNRDAVLNMSLAAVEFYRNNRTPEQMAGSIYDAVKYAQSRQP